jgi:hypothetical protein
MNNLYLFEVYNFFNKIRIGSNHDSGFVIGDIDVVYDCYIGVGNNGNESFSSHFIKLYNLNEFNSYCINNGPREYPYKYTTNISCIKKYIGNTNNYYITDLTFLLKKYKNIFLKIDIEGSEYEWLSFIDSNLLKNIKQMVIEFHYINSNILTSYEQKMECIKKLNITHHIIHAHGNNFEKVIKNMPDTIELTFINKEIFEEPPRLNTTPLPIPNIDFPNNPQLPDIDLNYYPFTSN